MKTLIELVKEAAENLKVGFSAFDVTLKIREMANQAVANNEDLDLPLSNENKGFKYHIGHDEVRAEVLALYNNRTLDRKYNGNYFMYSLAGVSAPRKSPTLQSYTPPVIATATTVADYDVGFSIYPTNKMISAKVRKYVSKRSIAPTLKQVQSLLKRDGHFTCANLDTLLGSNGLKVVSNTSKTPTSQKVVKLS